MLRIGAAGVRMAQQSWSARCAAALGGRTGLIDFGLIGRGQRFEAFRALGAHPSRPCWRIAEQRLPVPQQLLEWLESEDEVWCRLWPMRVAGRPAREWTERIAREVRIRGFMPIGAEVLTKEPFRQDGAEGEGAADDCRQWGSALSGRSLVIIDAARAGSRKIGLALSRAASAWPRSISAVVALEGVAGLMPRREWVSHAAEPRGEYGPVTVPGRTPRAAISAPDSRAGSSFAEGMRLAERGRHAAAEREMRAASAGFDRRGEGLRASDADVALGRLLLARGRSAEALACFERARRRCERAGAAGPALTACTLTGLALTDVLMLDRADTTLRAAYTAARAAGDDRRTREAATALARNLYWQEREASGLGVLKEIEGGACPHYWVRVTKLCLRAGRLDQAAAASSKASDALSSCGEPAIEALVRSALVALQGRLGDVDALLLHARSGIRAARAAHLPLQAVRIRLSMLEGLLDAGERPQPLRRWLEALRRPQMPALLQRRAERLARRLAEPAAGRTRPAAREPAAEFRVETGGANAIAEMVGACHEAADERDALVKLLLAVRKYGGGTAAGLFAADEGLPLLAASGSVSCHLARRCVESWQPVVAGPAESAGAGVEAAVPVIHLGDAVGALVCRWTAERSALVSDGLGLCRIAAALCAPLVQVLAERRAAGDQTRAAGGPIEIVGTSTAIEQLRRQIARAASAPFAVLIEGESGSGKELVARAIHRGGCRRDRPFCAMNCAALPDELVDAELFGHVKGAFTGALADRLGLFESADKGTLFLDEVGELTPRAQAKLLRAIQENEIRRIGESFVRPVDARLVVATNRPLRLEVEAGRFRQDLLYRLDVIHIAVPPLRERVEDLPLLAVRFWRAAADRIGTRAVLGRAAIATLARYDWPGNVRELQNVLAALAVSAGPRGVVSAASLPAAIAKAAQPEAGETLDAARRRFEERFVRAALARTSGHRGRAAMALGLSRQGLTKLMRRLRLT